MSVMLGLEISHVSERDKGLYCSWDHVAISDGMPFAAVIVCHLYPLVVWRNLLASPETAFVNWV